MFNSKIIPVVVFVFLGFSLKPHVSHAQSPDDIVIIVNKNVSVNYMSIEELKQIFLGKKSTWRNGNKIVCINAKSHSAIRKTFRKKVLEMTAKEELTYWETEKVRRQISPPMELSSTPKAVFKLKNTISYAYRKDVPQKFVKALLVIPR